MKRLNLFLILFSSLIYSQIDIDGQLNFQGNIGLDDDKILFSGLRYLPELNYEYELDSLKNFTVQLAGNLSASKFFNSQKKLIFLHTEFGLDTYINKLNLD